MTATGSASSSLRSPLVFPQGFTWGSATSAFQIEGAPLADGKSPSIWDVFSRKEGAIADGSNGDQACEHFERYQEDVALMADLGFGAYRFSLAWTRIAPGGTGQINQAGLDFYDKLIDALLEKGITPMPTLYHWDLPQVLEDKGGWVNRDIVHAFADYTEAAVARLGDRVGTWTTLNEPFVTANHGYVTGEHAPGRTSMAEGMAASHHLNLAHGMAAERIKAGAPDARLAIVLNFTPVEPATNSDADRIEAEHRNNLENRWYSDPIGGFGYPQDSAEHYGWDQAEVLDGDLDVISTPIDLLGVNYYSRNVVSADNSYTAPADTPRNTMGWEIHPPSLGRLLRELHARYSFPSIMITENGAPMPDQIRENGRIVDDDRLDFIRDHIAQVHEAMQDGVPVEGYLVWSLFDNFEWAYGFEPRFGIVEVNYDTQERIPKKSAEWFSSVAKTNHVTFEGEANG